MYMCVFIYLFLGFGRGGGICSQLYIVERERVKKRWRYECVSSWAFLDYLE